MASILKKTTSIAGLKVVNNPEHALRVVYGKVLRALQNIPPDAAYRKYTEEIITTRLQVVKDSQSIEEIETKINAGQIEELIQAAEHELVLARKFITWKPWEPLIAKPPPTQWHWPPPK